MPSSSQVVRVCPVAELGEGDVRGVVVGGRRVAVARHAGRLHGFGGVCPHERHDLSRGFIADDGITCSSHLWHFAFETGRCTMIPEVSIPLYAAREEDGWVVLEVPA